jgi:uncharacterized membrane protein YeaQ/YmgE (transglycosylase-associated protein family)
MRDEGVPDEARALSRARTGVIAGALCGGGLGLLLEVAWPGFGLASGVLIGVAGAVLGHAIATRFDVQEWEPGAGHSFVGAHAPDDDDSSEGLPGPERSSV